IRENLSSLGLTARAEVYCGKALPVIERVRANIVFLDPPYELEREYEAALTALGSSTSELVIAQHFNQVQLQHSYGGLSQFRTVTQGDHVLSFYEPTLSPSGWTGEAL